MLGRFSNDKHSARLFMLFSLIVLGFAGNYFALKLFTGFNYLFGSIAVMLVLQSFGLGWSLLAALVASSWTLILFGHPYAMIWLCCEALFVGFMVKRGTAKNIVLYDTLYWVLIGAPLIWLFFQYVIHVSVLGTVAALLMYWFVGITNALAASLIQAVFSQRDTGAVAKLSPPSLPIQNLIFNLLMAIVAVPAVVAMVLHGRSTESFYQREMREDLFDSSRIAGYELRLARSDRVADSNPDLGKILLVARVKDYQQLTLTGRAGRVLASTNTSISNGTFYDPLKDSAVGSVGERGIVQRVPNSSISLPLWLRASQSVYVLKTSLGNSEPWFLTAETPFAPYQNYILRDQINSLLLLLLFNLLALTISIMTARRLTAPLRILSQMTTDLPERLLHEKITSWPVSRVTEVDQLIANFRDMSTALNQKFHEIADANETLELRVEERTSELSRANEVLHKEMFDRQMTERQRDHLMNELVGQLGFLQTLIDTIPNPIFYKDNDGLYQGCNRAFEAAWGLSRNKIVGKKVHALYPPQTANIFDSSDRKLYDEGGVQVYEAQLRYADNLLHSVIVYKAVYADPSGKPGGLVGTIIDISDRKRAEAERDRLMIELRQKNKELEGIVYIASHDLRSPLINVQGFSRRLAKNCSEIFSIVSCLDVPDEAQQRLGPILSVGIPQAIGYITSSIEKMDGLLNGLLRLSRLGRAAICFEQLDMQIIVSKIIESLAFQIESANAVVEVGDLVGCLADAGQMSQVFSNLIDNAIKYRSKTRPLIVRVSSEEFQEGVRYCVKDNGVGIPPDQQDSIWELFNRLDPTGSEGEGLGLTMARRIIDRLGGSIWVESELDVGSRFYVVMPNKQSTDA